MNRTFIILGSLVLIVSFQNCQQAMNFSSLDRGQNKTLSGDLMAVEGDDSFLSQNDDATDSLVQQQDEQAQQEQQEQQPSESQQLPLPSTSSDDQDMQSNNGHASEQDHGPGEMNGNNTGKKNEEQVAEQDDQDEEQQQESEEQGAGEYVCILAGPGKSVKLGISGGGMMAGQNGIPGVLCMSEKACNDIASQAFSVKGPEKRGYCKESGGNPNVHHISDADLQTKVNALKAN